MSENVFIVADTYISKSILPYIDYLFNKNIDSVFMLDEFNSNCDYDDYKKHFNIFITQDYEKCISESDTILVFDNGKFKQSFIETVILSSKNKKTIIVSGLNEQIISNDIEDSDIDYCEIPSILLISFGDYNQHFSTEIMLNEFFNKENISFYQVFSPMVMNLLGVFHDNDILNPVITKSYSHYEKDNCSLIIRAFESSPYDYSIQNIKLITLIDKMSPDYIIVQTNSRMENSIEDFLQYFEVRFGKSVDCVISSHFVPTYFWSNCSTPLYKKTMTSKSEKNVLTIDEENSKIIQNDILIKLSYPNDTVLL